MSILNFRKRQTSESEELWTVVQKQEQESSLVFRIRENIPEGINTKDYPILLSIVWPYDIDQRGGMPSRHLNAEQMAFDDAIDSMDNPQSGFMMLVITGKGRREWLWYIKDVQAWQSGLQKCLVGHPNYPISIGASEESDWQTWHSILVGLQAR